VGASSLFLGHACGNLARGAGVSIPVRNTPNQSHEHII